MMNKQRRHQIGQIMAELDSLAFRIDEIMAAEQENTNNIPENMTTRIEAAEAVVDAMRAAMDAIDEAKDYLDDARQP